MKNIKKMMLALTMFSLESAYISASANSAYQNFFPADTRLMLGYNITDQSGQWYKDAGKAIVNAGKSDEKIYTKALFTYVYDNRDNVSNYAIIGYTSSPIYSSGSGTVYSILYDGNVPVKKSSKGIPGQGKSYKSMK